MDTKDPEFLKRREKAMAEVQLLDKDVIHNNPEREAFFETVYDRAEGDAAAVPWADLAAKHKLAEWLEANPDHKGRAMDVGCGLGDNAEALTEAGYQTSAFDFSPKAIDWATSRFPDSSVEYRIADLFNLPAEWDQAFELVHECYTLQSIPPETLEKSIPAVANLVAPGGILLVYTRIRPEGGEVDGPPWPLEEAKAMSFDLHGLELVSREDFELERPGRTIPHVFCVWRRPE
ncbi:MAG: methyltransferase domain-containing protein [Pseudomonadota bacterium]